MKAEKRKEIETNSLVLAVQRLRKHASGRTLYYVIGSLAVVAAIIGFYYYFAGEKTKARDAILLQLATADTPEKLKAGMEEHRGTIYGSLFKIHLARHYLRNEGLPKLGTESSTTRLQAANSVDEARRLYLELTSEFNEKEEPGLLQEAWIGAAEAEEALVGLAKADDKDPGYRGSAEKTIEYYEKAAAIFPESESSKRHKSWAEKIQSNKEKFVSDQREIYKPARSLFPSSKTDPLGPGLPSTPKGGLPPAPPIPPPIPTPSPDPKVPEPPKVLDPKNNPDPKSTEPRPSDPPKGTDPKKSPEPKPADPPKGPDPKAK